MPRKSYFLGCRRVGRYEIGRDPRFFEASMGFAWKDFLCELDHRIVEDIWKITLKPGELVRLKLGTQKAIPLTEEEKEEISKWKSSSTQRKTRK
jgi:hypothetical protein